MFQSCGPWCLSMLFPSNVLGWLTIYLFCTSTKNLTFKSHHTYLISTEAEDTNTFIIGALLDLFKVPGANKPFPFILLSKSRLPYPCCVLLHWEWEVTPLVEGGSTSILTSLSRRCIPQLAGKKDPSVTLENVYAWFT